MANNWDVQTSPNWLNGTTNDVFYTYDAVTFNDASTNYTVNIDANVQPGSITVNTTNDYVFNGTASSNIIGATSLTKLGSGTLTITENNSYIGVTTYGGGSISVATTVGGNGTNSLLGAVQHAGQNQRFLTEAHWNTPAAVNLPFAPSALAQTAGRFRWTIRQRPSLSAPAAGGRRAAASSPRPGQARSPSANSRCLRAQTASSAEY